MNTYLLEAKEESLRGSVGNLMIACVVLAENEEQAREMAALNGDPVAGVIWENPEHSDCERVDDSSEPQVLLIQRRHR